MRSYLINECYVCIHTCYLQRCLLTPQYGDHHQPVAQHPYRPEGQINSPRHPDGGDLCSTGSGISNAGHYGVILEVGHRLLKRECRHNAR